MKQIYVVLGMMRAESDPAAKALGTISSSHLLECWEASGHIYRLNKRLFKMLGESWMSARLVEEAKLSDAKLIDWEWKAIYLLQERLFNRQYWSLNDPSMTKLLVFWQRIFSKLNLVDNYLIGYCDPHDFARRYSALSGERFESCLLFWLVAMVGAIEGTHGRRRILLSDYIDKNNIAFSQANDVNDAVPLCNAVYHLLSRVSLGELTLESEAFSSEWKVIMDEYHQRYPLYCYVNTVLHRKRRLDKQLTKITQSLPWKLALPFRLLESAVRFVRGQNREREVKL